MGGVKEGGAKGSSPGRGMGVELMRWGGGGGARARRRRRVLWVFDGRGQANIDGYELFTIKLL